MSSKAMTFALGVIAGVFVIPVAMTIIRKAKP